ncbi:MAG TPA: hypothetical protein PLD25_31750 [Chloroflexota bacterium]|nr:hypothetical protein [Chloroflexota bacterium]HUM68456.1 hypothetical protein [Chloroflexota bacterium]
MNQSIEVMSTRSTDGKTFTLSIKGEQRTYTNDKEGKRQAILDGLNALKTITIGQDVYLPSHEALQVVAAVLYPDGIQTESAYQTVCDVTEKACAHLGYGVEEQLGPPVVPFAARGAYRKRYPPVDEQMIRRDLELAGTSSAFPQQEVVCTVIWNQAGLDVYGRHWSHLTPAEQTLIQTQVDDIATRTGWGRDDRAVTALYTRPLPANEAAARRQLAQLIRQENGRPLLVSSVIYQVQLGAYGRGFYTNELAPALQTIVAETLQANGYRPTPEEGEYRPLPITLPSSVTDDLAGIVAAIKPVTTEFGQAILLPDLLTAVMGSDQALSEWQAKQVVQDGRVSQALRQLGYQTELTWLQAYHFRPRLGAGTERSRSDDVAHQVILKEVRVQNDPHKTLSLAQGLSVYTPALVIDNTADNIVYLEMVGAKQSVKANWAALVGGGKVHWLGQKRICLDGMKNHVKLQSSLPCGWANHILIHKQASLREMNPEEPFYLLDDGTQPIPPLFYPMLNKCLALPLLPEWVGYLWANGRERNLITLLDNGEGQGYAAWRVLPAHDVWQSVVQAGLQSEVIAF